MELKVNLPDEQIDILASLSKIMSLPANEVLSLYITLVLVQAEPIHHMLRVVESSGEILPSFIRAVAASRSPQINLGNIIEDLLLKLFSDSSVYTNLDKIREYFATSVAESNTPQILDNLPPGPIDIDTILTNLLRKEKDDEADQT